MLKKSRCLKEFGIEETAIQQELKSIIIQSNKKMKTRIHLILQQNQEESHLEKQQEVQDQSELQVKMESQELGRVPIN